MARRGLARQGVAGQGKARLYGSAALWVHATGWLGRYKPSKGPPKQVRILPDPLN